MPKLLGATLIQFIVLLDLWSGFLIVIEMPRKCSVFLYFSTKHGGLWDKCARVLHFVDRINSNGCWARPQKNAIYFSHTLLFHSKHTRTHSIFVNWTTRLFQLNVVYRYIYYLCFATSDNIVSGDAKSSLCFCFVFIFAVVQSANSVDEI